MSTRPRRAGSLKTGQDAERIIHATRGLELPRAPIEHQIDLEVSLRAGREPGAAKHL